MSNLLNAVAFSFLVSVNATEPKKITAIDSAPSPVIFELKMGHLNEESIRFSSLEVGPSSVIVASYLINGKVERERVIPDQMARNLIADFDRAVSPADRLKLFSIENCAQPYLLSTRKTGHDELVKESFCFDEAGRIPQGAVSQWWKRMRNILRI